MKWHVIGTCRNVRQPVAELAGLCAKHAEQLKKEPGNSVPKEPCRLALDTLKSLEKQFTDLGWTHPAATGQSLPVSQNVGK